MITAQTDFCDGMEKRYHRLAGPFLQEEEGLFTGFISYMQKTGARILTVREDEGITVWRIRSECETIEETRTRLRKKP